MADKRVEWTVDLYRYNLGKNQGAWYPCVKVLNTIDLDGVINSIVKDRSELRKETMRSVAMQLFDKMEELLIEGYAVSTSLGTLTPTVKGMWNSNRLSPEARAENQASLNFTMSKRLKKSFCNPLFKVGRQPTSAPYIHHYINYETMERNGALTPGGYILLEGKLLLMNGDLPERGLYLLEPKTRKQVLFLPADRFVMNSRSQILFALPKDTPEGEYILQIRSQCTTSPRPLKSAARGEWIEPVVVKGSL